MKNLTLLAVLAMTAPQMAIAGIDAKLFRYADVSESHIAFVYGGDIWLVDRAGGTASQVTHSPGQESWPRFSPDGSMLAFSANYNGNMDVFAMPVTGGVPTRVTYQSHGDRMVEWHPDGEHILFASRRESGRQSFSQLYLVGKEGGMPKKLDVPYGELASFSPDGKHLAYITKITENYPFKRYRGGLTSDIILFDLENNTAENITENHANDGKPAWLGKNVYFVSDQDSDMRLNIWAYDTESGETMKITNFKNFDISNMTAGPDALVYEAGGDLYLYDVAAGKSSVVEISVVSDLSIEMPRQKDVSRNISNATASPEGKRVVFEARGELFNVPAKEGYSVNMTKSSGAFDQQPAWSPDGKHIAYWSDKSGEYEIYLQVHDLKSEAQQLTQRGKGFGYKLHWSPDSEHIAFIDEKNDISIVSVESGEIKKVDNTDWNQGHGGRYGYDMSWSHDSKWLAYTKGLNNTHNAVFLYNTVEGAAHQATSGFYNDVDPKFSVDGEYLFFLTDRNLSPHYSDMGDGTWVYPNATQIAAVSLRSDVPSLYQVKNDVFEVEEDAEEEEESEGEQDEESSEEEEAEDNEAEEAGDEESDDEEEETAIEIETDGFESRLEILEVDAGNIGGIFPFEDKFVYVRFPNTGADGEPALMLYDLKEHEEKEVMARVSGYSLSADGKMLLVRSGQKFGLIKPAPGQKINDAIPTDGLVMDLVPKDEWRQIFNDTWRRHRDFFYDPAMHGIDWDEMRDRYGALIEDARTRWDVTFIQSNLVSELSAGHTYSSGGDVESIDFVQTGYLGIDWELADGKYRIARIVRPAEWDVEARSPFDKSGMTVKRGHVIHSVNGVALDSNKDPYAPFEGLSGKTVSLMVSESGAEADAEEVLVECLTQRQETNLRYLEWIENNRKMVHELSDGRLGYIYMSNTAGAGQRELVRMYYGQLGMDGYVLDERFNGGGQLADRFLELLQRPVVYNLHWRHGRDHTWPRATNTGPVGMLINGWAGSGGDGLPWAFQELKAGPIVGERTLGILVGPATGHRLIDGGRITVPGARLYDNDGHWFWEGEGVSPDIEVWDDPNILVQGRDPQVERVVQELMKTLAADGGPAMTPAPAPEDRTAKGLSKTR